ncbi:MAG: tetratricopeptide repeat protein [Deltaproteobacteria bacterium]|nr:tetratricopeptide repeat protein [Deltaproteobacteria bacterium]
MKKLTRTSVLFIVAMIATGCLRRDYIARGEQAMAAEDYKTAEIYFRKAIQKAPRSDRAFYALGTAYLKDQDYNFAYQSFARAAELNPRNGQATVEAGKILLLANQPIRAEQQARQALQYEPHLLPAALLLGEALVAQDKTEAARTTLEQAVREQPKSSEAYLALAALESHNRNSDQTLANFNTAIASDPHNPDSYVAKAQYLRSIGKLKDAILVLRRGLQSNPSSVVLKLLLADALLDDRQSVEAMTLLRSIKETGPPGTLAHARLAIAEVESNQLDAASAEISNLVDRGAGSTPDVMYARARLLLAQKKMAEAEHVLVDLTDVAPKFAPGFYYLGAAYAASNDLSKARQQLETAIKLAPNSEMYRVLAAVDLKQGYYPGALEAVNHALQYSPDNIQALLLKGDALAEEGQYQQAEQAFRQVTKLAPQNSVAHKRLGQVAVKRNDLVSAANEFEAALRLDPKQSVLLNDLALVLLKTKGKVAAEDRIRQQIKKQPENADFHALLAVFLMNDHQLDQASAELKSALKNDPDEPNLYFMLARVYQTQGNTGQADVELKASLAHRSNFGPALQMLGAMANREGRLDEAIGYYQRLVAAAPNSAIAANNLAYEYLRANRNLDQALELAQRARQLSPHDPHVADTLGEVMLARGLPENAMQLFRESVQADASAPSPHYHLGFALLALKQRSEAGAELSTALKLAPDAPEAGEAREDLAQLAKK